MLEIGPFKITKPFILAPMAGVSQMPFRRLAMTMGAGLAPTELISAKGLYFENLRTKTYLTYDQEVERPFSVQLFGGEEEAMAVAAEKAMAMGADIIDINMGCPVKKVTKTNAGSALMCDYQRAYKIVRAMIKQTGDKIPITAKIRSGWDQDNLNYLDVGKSLEDAGMKALAIHPRTRAQGYSGLANWDHIAHLKANLKVAIIGNGDVKNLRDAQKMFATTKCDAVMVGRAALGNPWIFTELSQNQEVSISPLARLKIITAHLEDHINLQKIIADHTSDKSRTFSMPAAVKSFRSHLVWYSKGMMGGAKFREQVMKCEDINQLKDQIEMFFANSEKFLNEKEICDDGIDYRQAFG